MQRYSKRSCLWSMSKRLSGRWTKLSESRLLPIQSMCTRYVTLWWLEISHTHVHTFTTQFKFRYVRKPILFHIQFNICEKIACLWSFWRWYTLIHTLWVFNWLIEHFSLKNLTNHMYLTLKYISPASIFQSLYFYHLPLLGKALHYIKAFVKVLFRLSLIYKPLENRKDTT